jgi:hypothetical protein
MTTTAGTAGSKRCRELSTKRSKIQEEESFYKFIMRRNTFLASSFAPTLFLGDGFSKIIKGFDFFLIYVDKGL